MRVNRVGLGFIIAYAAAYLAHGSRYSPPSMNPLNVAQLVFISTLVNTIFLAIGGGGNYTALFIAAAMFALPGALSIQPVKGVR